jgi:hypothetical protein
MIQNITKHIPLTTLIISYFFICGGLYLIGFWGTFDIDITNIISLSDIPKSFIVPFAFSQGFALLNSAINVMIFTDTKDNKPTVKKWEPVFWKRLLKMLISIDFIILMSFTIIFKLYSTYKLDPGFWFLSALILSYLISFKLISNNSLKLYIPFYTLRFYLITTIISIPLLSYAIGKSNSLTIYNNSKYRIVINSNAIINQQIADSTSSKFLGFLGDKLIISSFDNKIITFINQSSIDSVQIQDKK